MESGNGASFTDDDLKRLKEEITDYRDGNKNRWLKAPYDIHALLARLEAAELKDCNQYHCGHPTCNAWRKAAGQ